MRGVRTAKYLSLTAGLAGLLLFSLHPGHQDQARSLLQTFSGNIQIIIPDSMRAGFFLCNRFMTRRVVTS